MATAARSTDGFNGTAGGSRLEVASWISSGRCDTYQGADFRFYPYLQTDFEEQTSGQD